MCFLVLLAAVVLVGWTQRATIYKFLTRNRTTGDKPVRDLPPRDEQ
jgi:hypothetical protein